LRRWEPLLNGLLLYQDCMEGGKGGRRRKPPPCLDTPGKRARHAPRAPATPEARHSSAPTPLLPRLRPWRLFRRKEGLGGGMRHGTFYLPQVDSCRSAASRRQRWMRYPHAHLLPRIAAHRCPPNSSASTPCCACGRKKRRAAPAKNEGMWEAAAGMVRTAPLPLPTAGHGLALSLGQTAVRANLLQTYNW